MGRSVPYGSLLKGEKVKRAPGRARPSDPLRDWCEVGAGVCTGRATCRHHVLPRSAGGTDHRENTLDACDACHVYLHAHPTESYARGWLRRRG